MGETGTRGSARQQDDVKREWWGPSPPAQDVPPLPRVHDTSRGRKQVDVRDAMPPSSPVPKGDGDPSTWRVPPPRLAVPIASTPSNGPTGSRTPFEFSVELMYFRRNGQYILSPTAIATATGCSSIQRKSGKGR